MRAVLLVTLIASACGGMTATKWPRGSCIDSPPAPPQSVPTGTITTTMAPGLTELAYPDGRRSWCRDAGSQAWCSDPVDPVKPGDKPKTVTP